MWYISTVKFSIMINGTPVDFFGSTRGIHQGNPLSPLIFYIVLGFESYVGYRCYLGQFSSFSIGSLVGTLLTMFHLLLANDTLIFWDGDSPFSCFVWDFRQI